MEDGIVTGFFAIKALPAMKDDMDIPPFELVLSSDEEAGSAPVISSRCRTAQAAFCLETAGADGTAAIDQSNFHRMQSSMKNYSVGFGHAEQTLCVPEKNVLAFLSPNAIPSTGTEKELIEKAMRGPVNCFPQERLVSPGKKIAIVTSDITRPMPSQQTLPLLLRRLREAGIPDPDITIVFGLGSHRLHNKREKRHLAGHGIYEFIRCLDSSEKDFVLMGITSSGTPVEITRTVGEADIRICLGNIEYHYFAGYSGGAKAIMPGVSTRKAIQANHAEMTRPEAAAGLLEGNPVRDDLEEAVHFCPIHFLLNVVLDEHKKVIFAAAGHYIDAHREGCRFLDRLYKTEIPRKADIVIASQGGAPKDLNLYQTH